MNQLGNDAGIIWLRMIWVLCWYHLFLPLGEKQEHLGSFIGLVLEFYLAISPQLLIPLNFDEYLDD